MKKLQENTEEKITGEDLNTSQLSEYDIGHEVSLKKKQLNTEIVYSMKVNNFAKHVAQTLTFKRAFQLALEQFLPAKHHAQEYDQDKDIHKKLDQILKDKQFIKQYQLKQLKILDGKATNERNKILVAIIIFQYFGYSQLLTLKIIKQHQRIAITKLFAPVNIFQYYIPYKEIIIKAFAKYINEDWKKTRELISAKTSDSIAFSQKRNLHIRQQIAKAQRPQLKTKVQQISDILGRIHGKEGNNNRKAIKEGQKKITLKEQIKEITNRASDGLIPKQTNTAKGGPKQLRQIKREQLKINEKRTDDEEIQEAITVKSPSKPSNKTKQQDEEELQDDDISTACWYLDNHKYQFTDFPWNGDVEKENIEKQNNNNIKKETNKNTNKEKSIQSSKNKDHTENISKIGSPVPFAKLNQKQVKDLIQFQHKITEQEPLEHQFWILQQLQEITITPSAILWDYYCHELVQILDKQIIPIYNTTMEEKTNIQHQEIERLLQIRETTRNLTMAILFAMDTRPKTPQLTQKVNREIRRNFEIFKLNRMELDDYICEIFKNYISGWDTYSNFGWKINHAPISTILYDKLEKKEIQEILIIPIEMIQNHSRQENQENIYPQQNRLVEPKIQRGYISMLNINEKAASEQTKTTFEATRNNDKHSNNTYTNNTNRSQSTASWLNTDINGNSSSTRNEINNYNGRARETFGRSTFSSNMQQSTSDKIYQTLGARKNIYATGNMNSMNGITTDNTNNRYNSSNRNNNRNTSYNRSYNSKYKTRQFPEWLNKHKNSGDGTRIHNRQYQDIFNESNQNNSGYGNIGNNQNKNNHQKFDNETTFNGYGNNNKHNRSNDRTFTDTTQPGTGERKENQDSEEKKEQNQTGNQENLNSSFQSGTTYSQPPPGPIPNIIPTQQQTNPVNAQVFGSGNPIENWMAFEVQKIDLQASVTKLTEQLNCSTNSPYVAAKEALTFIHACWRWWQIEIKPKGTMSEANAVNILTTRFGGKAKKKWNRQQQARVNQIRSIEELTKWIQEQFINITCFVELKRDILNTKFRTIDLEQNLATAFDDFESEVRVYNSLLYSLGENAYQQYKISDIKMFQKVRNFLLKIGILSKINAQLSGRLAAPNNWPHLKQALRVYQQKSAYIRTLQSMKKYGNYNRDKYNRDTDQIDYNENNDRNKENEIPDEINQINYINYKQQKDKYRQNRYKNNRNYDSKSRNRNRKYRGRRYDRYHRNNNKNYHSRSRSGSRHSSRYSSRSYSNSRSRSRNSRSPYRHSYSKPKRNASPFNTNTDNIFKNTKSTTNNIENTYNNNNKYKGKYRNRYKYEKDYYYCKLCGNKHKTGSKCRASTSTKDKYQQRKSQKQVYNISQETQEQENNAADTLKQIHETQNNKPQNVINTLQPTIDAFTDILRRNNSPVGYINNIAIENDNEESESDTDTSTLESDDTTIVQVNKEFNKGKTEHISKEKNKEKNTPRFQNKVQIIEYDKTKEPKSCETASYMKNLAKTRKYKYKMCKEKINMISIKNNTKTTKLNPADYITTIQISAEPLPLTRQTAISEEDKIKANEFQTKEQQTFIQPKTKPVKIPVFQKVLHKQQLPETEHQKQTLTITREPTKLSKTRTKIKTFNVKISRKQSYITQQRIQQIETQMMQLQEETNKMLNEKQQYQRQYEKMKDEILCGKITLQKDNASREDQVRVLNIIKKAGQLDIQIEKNKQAFDQLDHELKEQQHIKKEQQETENRLEKQNLLFPTYQTNIPRLEGSDQFNSQDSDDDSIEDTIKRYELISALQRKTGLNKITQQILERQEKARKEGKAATTETLTIKIPLLSTKNTKAEQQKINQHQNKKDKENENPNTQVSFKQYKTPNNKVTQSHQTIIPTHQPQALPNRDTQSKNILSNKNKKKPKTARIPMKTEMKIKIGKNTIKKKDSKRQAQVIKIVPNKQENKEKQNTRPVESSDEMIIRRNKETNPYSKTEKLAKNRERQEEARRHQQKTERKRKIGRIANKIQNQINMDSDPKTVVPQLISQLIQEIPMTTPSNKKEIKGRRDVKQELKTIVRGVRLLVEYVKQEQENKVEVKQLFKNNNAIKQHPINNTIIQNRDQHKQQKEENIAQEPMEEDDEQPEKQNIQQRENRLVLYKDTKPEDTEMKQSENHLSNNRKHNNSIISNINSYSINNIPHLNPNLILTKTQYNPNPSLQLTPYNQRQHDQIVQRIVNLYNDNNSNRRQLSLNKIIELFKDADTDTKIQFCAIAAQCTVIPLLYQPGSTIETRNYVSNCLFCDTSHKIPNKLFRDQFRLIRQRKKEKYNKAGQIMTTYRITSLDGKRDRTKLWEINEHIQLDNKIHRIQMMADTGATVSAINADLAKECFPHHIKKLTRAIPINTAGHEIQVTHLIEFTFIDIKNGNRHITVEDFYLLENLSVAFLASISLLKRLGWSFQNPRKEQYIHKPRKDEDFASNNNWDDPVLRPHYNEHFKQYIKKEQDHCTPYQAHINLCTQANTQFKLKSTITAITKNGKRQIIYPEMINTISNFKASPEELTKEKMEEAKKLTKDKQFAPVDLEHIKTISMWLYHEMRRLCYEEYADVWAKHQFHTKTIPNKEFRIDLKDSAKDQKIYKPQYHLNDQKRLVVTYNAIRAVKSGLYKPNPHSIHNVPIIVIRRKDGRLRLAYDLTKLNKYTKDVQSHLPSYNYLFEKMRGPGYCTTSDLKNFFENIKIKDEHQDLVTVTTTIGRFKLTHATYGFKNIATKAQQISDEVITSIQDACAFIDDIFMKHPPDATPKQLLEAARRFLQRARQVGVLLHPEKTHFFVEAVEFLGYIFTQEGHRPRPEYIEKVLKIQKPKTVKQIQAYLGLIQYIARYVHKLADWTRYFTVLTRKENKKKWGEAQDQAFAALQERIKNIKLLYHPTENDRFLVQCDSSKYAIAGVLYQHQYDKKLKKKQWKIIEFYSKQLEPHLIKHPIMVKECLAIAYSLNHWKHFLLRGKFFLDTDHKNLISLYDDDETKAPEMRKKQIFQTLKEATAMYHFELAHLQGKDIILADYLSRDGCMSDQERKTAFEAVKPKFDNTPEGCQLINALQNMHEYRQQLFDKRATQKPEYINFIEYKKTKRANKVFTLQDLEYEYYQDYGYQANITKYTSIKSDQNNWQKPKDKYQKPSTNQNHDTKQENETSLQLPNINTPGQTEDLANRAVEYLNTVQQSIMKEKQNHDNTIFNFEEQTKPIRKPPALYEHKQPKSILKNTVHNIPFSIKYNLYNTKPQSDLKLKKNLAKAIINTVNNSQQKNLIDTKNIDKAKQLFLLYTNVCNQLDSRDMEYLTTIRPEKTPVLGENYNTDNQDRRRGIRIRKKTKAFWQWTDSEIKKGEETTPEEREAEESQQQETNRALDLFGENSQNLKYKHKNTYVKTFYPYSITANLVQQFYSRLNLPEKYMETLSSEKIKYYQHQDEIIQHIFNILKNNNTASTTFLKTEYPRIHQHINKEQFIVSENVLFFKKNQITRLVIPNKLIHPILEYTHTVQHLHHPGVRQMQEQLKRKFYWYKMNEDIRNYVTNCEICMQGKGSKSYRTGRLAPSELTQFGHTLHFDFAGPILKRDSILIMVCATTGYVELVQTTNQDTKSVVFALFRNWIPRHGVPVYIVSDRGQAFISHANKIICKTLGIKNIFSSAYHPQTNAKAERVVKEVKKALRMVNITWDEALTPKNPSPRETSHIMKQISLLLPAIQFSINQRIHSITQVSPNMLVYGKNMREQIDMKLATKLLVQIPQQIKHPSALELVKQIEFMIQRLREQQQQKHDQYIIIMKRNYDWNKHDDDYKIGDTVAYYIGDRSATSSKLRRRFSGPWKIISRLRHNTCEIKNIHTEEIKATHVCMLKKYNPKQFVPLIELQRSERAKKEAKDKQTAKEQIQTKPTEHPATVTTNEDHTKEPQKEVNISSTKKEREKPSIDDDDPTRSSHTHKLIQPTNKMNEETPVPNIQITNNTKHNNARITKSKPVKHHHVIRIEIQVPKEIPINADQTSDRSSNKPKKPTHVRKLKTT